MSERAYTEELSAHIRHIKSLAQRLVETEAALEALTGFEVDAVLDPHGNGAILLRQTQQRLREYRTLFELEADAVFLIDNGTGSIIEANNAAARLYGYDHDTLLTLRNVDLSAEAEETMRATLGEAPAVPLRFHRKRDGTVFPVEITATHFEWRGRQCHIAAIRDITQRKAAEDQMRRMNEQLALELAERRRLTGQLHEQASLLELTHDGIIVRDLAGHILYWNQGAAEMYGYSATEALGQVTHTLLRTEFPEGLDTVNDVLLRTGRWDGELHHTCRDGSRLIVLSRQTLERDSDGEPRRILEINRDITRRKQAEQMVAALEHLDSMTRIAGSITHALSNKLTALTLQLGLSRDQAPAGSAASLYLEKSLATAGEITELATQLRLYTGHAWQVKEDLNVNDVLRINQDRLAAMIPDQIALHMQLAQEIPTISADPSQIRQILFNLVSNAVEAIDRKQGTVTVATGVGEADCVPAAGQYVAGFDPVPGQAYVYLTVEDDGEGIEAKNLAHIWDPFFTTRFMGRGLGLAVVLGIVRGLSGALYVGSTVGRGTIVRVYLPARNVVTASAVPGEVND